TLDCDYGALSVAQFDSLLPITSQVLPRAALHSSGLPAGPCWPKHLPDAGLLFGRPGMSSSGSAWLWQLFSPPGVQPVAPTVPPLLKQSISPIHSPTVRVAVGSPTQALLQSEKRAAMLASEQSALGVGSPALMPVTT